MRVKFYFLFLFVTLFLTVNLFSQDEERWSKPFTRLEINNQFSQEQIQINFDAIKREIANIKPLRTVLADKTYTVYPNIRVWPNNGMTQSEVHIAVNPNNPNILLGGSNAANNSSTVTYVNQGYYVTTNGGNTWYGSDSLPGIPAGYYRSDPVVAFDYYGNMYFNTLEYSASAGDLVTLKSTDNGLTWPIKVAVPNPGIDEDKNWIAIDVNPASPYFNYIYTAYTEFQSTDSNYRRLEFSRSTDGGMTFSAPINMSGTAGYLHQGVNLAVAPNGDVVAAYTHYPTSTLTTSHVTFAKSTDGGLTWTQQFVVSNIYDIRGNLIKGGNTIRVNSFPYIAVDHSFGPRRGWIYITYAARPATGQPPDVYLVKSTDGGTTWSSPIKVNSEPANRDQWFPAIAVDPADGSVNIVYYDSRNYSNNDSTEVYLSRSLDGGVTFEDIKVSDQAHLPRAIAGLATGYQGDYIGITAKNGVVWPFWNENRLGFHQAYTAKVFFIQINHTKLPNTENLNGPYTVAAKITSSIGIEEAKVFWRRGTTGAFDSLLMSRVTPDSFVVDIPGNGQPAIYQYYIFARDSVGSFATLPGGAPNEVFQFEVGIDLLPPLIAHTVLPDQYREIWPPTVSATVTDNIGVDSVWVVFKKNYDGTQLQFYLLPTSGDVYLGQFNLPANQLVVGDTIYYRIIARDKALNQNIGYHPSEDGYNSFKIIGDNEFPLITHNPLPNQAIVRWPSKVNATVTDNLGVDSVWVEWFKNSQANYKRFNLDYLGNNKWEGTFNSDTLEVTIGDSIFYRIVARDISDNQNVSYLPETGFYKFEIINTKGIVLVVDDDSGEEFRVSPEKGQFRADLTSPLGVSATLFKNTLDSLGYLVDLVPFTVLDTNTLNNYDILILSAGSKTTSIFNDQGKRDAIRTFANTQGKKTWVEGGEVGYYYRSTGTNDQLFRQEVLFVDRWVSDVASGLLNKKDASHPINSSPNLIPDNLSFTGTSYGVRDAMTVLPGARVYPVSTWSLYPDSGGIIVNDKTPNPESADNVFYTFSIGAMDNVDAAKKLIENTADYLMTVEAPPLGSIAGTVTLQGASNHGGVVVNLSGTMSKSTVTAADGSYSFDSLYNGNYRITAIAPEGYFPYSQYQDTVIVNGESISGINFTFVPILTGTISGTVTLSGAPDNSGVVVKVVNQPGKQDTTDALGNYQISDVMPGQVIVKFSKQGYGTRTFDTTLANGGTLVLNATLEPTLGYVLIIDDDASLADRVNPEKQGEADLTTPLGASATLFKTTLDSLGYTTDLVTFAALDTNVLVNYDVLILTAGSKSTNIFADAGKRTAIRNYATMPGTKTLVEGGEVGYYFRSTSTTADSLFRKQVLYTSRWVSDATSGALKKKLPDHPIWNVPNSLPDNIGFTGTSIYTRDAMRVDWEPSIIYHAGTYTSHPDSGSIVVHDKTPNPSSADNIFFTFNISQITDQSLARKLIHNTITYLLNQEAPPLGSIAGTVTLQGASNHGGVVVNLSGTMSKSTVTAADGSYSFDSLYNGNYRITAIAPEGYFPYSQYQDTVIVNGESISGINFTFVPILTGTISGTVTLSGAPDNSGVVVKVVNQPGKQDTTDALGNYQISDVMPGQVIVKFSKQGYGTRTFDTTLANGGTLVLNATLEPTLGYVLIIDDDASLADRVNPEKQGEADLTTPLGASATLFKTTLDSLGYTTDLVTFAALDTNVLVNYDVLILTAGSKSTNIFADAGKRTAIRNYATMPGTKTLVEGGEVGYYFRSTSTTADSLFRKQVLYTSRWVSDATSGALKKKLPDHPIWNVPNSLPDNIGFTGTSIYTRDAMRVDWEPSIIYHAGTYTSHPDSGSIVVHDKTPNPSSADNIFFTFNISQITDQSLARKLIHNTITYLLNQEAPPLGVISGTVTLQGAPNSGGVEVRLTGTVSKVTYTAPDGSYSFDSLYSGLYRITAIAPTGWFPYTQFVDTSLTSGQQISNIDFTFVPLVTGTVSGTVTIENQTDHSGVLVRVLGQEGREDTTDASGAYQIDSVNPGNIIVQFKKQGLKTVSVDTVLPNGGSLVINQTMVSTLGNVLVIDDDSGEQYRISSDKQGSYNLTQPLGLSANIIKQTLDSLGYNADYVTFSSFDTTVLIDYDLVVLSAGPKTSSIFNDQAKRDAIRGFANTPGKKTWVEGGEVGYYYRSTGTNDQLFRQEVLFVDRWLSDVSTGLLNKKLADHPINSIPNPIPDGLAFAGTGFGERDAMTVLPGARVYPVSTWSTFPDSGGIIVNDKNPNPLSADNVFFTFNLGGMLDLVSAKKLIENTAKYLFTVEPPPTGAIAGTAQLNGAPNNEGVTLKLFSLPSGNLLNTYVTDSTGNYLFSGLYQGTYRVEATPPSGFYPYVVVRDTIVGTDTVYNVDFVFINENIPQTVNFGTLAGWNLLSVPLNLEDMSKGNLFPMAASSAFTFSENLGYIKHDTLIHGKGYWIKFNEDTTHSFTAPPTYVLQIPVMRGWNLIGASHAYIPVGNVTTNPSGILVSPFFEYNGGYTQAAGLSKGKGYWVKAKQNGTVILQSTYPKTLSKDIVVENIDASWPTIIITDAKGNKSRLYLTVSDKITSSFELPPIPPNGAFDVRFDDNKYVNDLASGNYIIKLNSVDYPISIRLENFTDEQYLLSDGLDGKIYEEFIANGEERIINNPMLSAITLQKVVIPSEFDLSQNYPNPFNPSTVIKFALPENSHVTLEVYNVLGEKIRTLVNGELKAGYHSITFDGRELSSGVYLYRLETSKFSSVKKMILMK